MSSSIIPSGQCCDPCPDVTGEQGPQGPVGPQGDPGTDGTDGINAYSTVGANFVMPLVASTVDVTYADSVAWMVIGQIVFVEVAGYMQVDNVVGQVVTLENLGYPGNFTPGFVVAAGTFTSPGGLKGIDGSSGSVVLDDISPTTTKGDLIVDNGANNPNASDVRFGVGSNGQVLTAQSGQPTGLLWQAIDVSGVNSSITGILPFANGGTSQATQVAASYKLGIRWTNVNYAGMAAVSPEFFNQFAIDNDNFIWRGQSTAAGDWLRSWGCAGRFFAGGITGLGANEFHGFFTNGLVDFSTIQARDYAHTSFAGYGILSYDGNLELAFNISNNSATGYYKNNFFLQSNPRDTSGATSPIGLGIGFITFPGAVQHLWNWMYFNPNGDIDFFNSQSVGSGQTDIDSGPVCLHIDGTLGVTNFTSMTEAAVSGPGTITISGAGVVTGNGSCTFTTSFLTNRVFVVGTDVYHVIKVTNDNSMQVAEPVSQAAGSAYSIYPSGAAIFGLTKSTQVGVFVGGDGYLIVNGGSTASIYLQEQGASPSSWRIGSGNGTFSLTDVPGNKGPFAISQGAGNNSLQVNSDSSVNLQTGPLKIAATRVVTTRQTGWGTPTATQLRTALTNASTATDVLQHLSALETDLIAHGLIGA